MKALMQAILGGARFGEDEEHLRFRFRFLFVLLVIGACTSGFFQVEHHAETNSMGAVHAIVQKVHVGVCVLAALLL